MKLVRDHISISLSDREADLIIIEFRNLREALSSSKAKEEMFTKYPCIHFLLESITTSYQNKSFEINMMDVDHWKTHK